MSVLDRIFDVVYNGIPSTPFKEFIKQAVMVQYKCPDNLTRRLHDVTTHFTPPFSYPHPYPHIISVYQPTPYISSSNP
jgi:hypothetical protein